MDIEAFLQKRDELAQKAIYTNDDVIRRIQLLWMPDVKSLFALRKFYDRVWVSLEEWCKEWAGDAVLAPAEYFSLAGHAEAERSGGRLLYGYRFEYPCEVKLPWEWRITDWCASVKESIGYAVELRAALYVCAASLMLAGR